MSKEEVEKNKKEVETIDRRLQEKEVVFPRFEYDHVPMSLYWYAKKLPYDMPIVQYLLFYQVIEYYYPAFFQKELTDKIRNILKNPVFRLDHDENVGKITSLMLKDRNATNEKSQLKAVLKHCIDIEEFNNSFRNSKYIIDFLTKKHDGVTRYKLVLNSNNHDDFISSLSDLIYDIRCSIVHVKNDYNEQESSIIPGSDGEKVMYNYIALIGHVARAVLVKTSCPLSL